MTTIARGATLTIGGTPCTGILSAKITATATPMPNICDGGIYEQEPATKNITRTLTVTCNLGSSIHALTLGLSAVTVVTLVDGLAGDSDSICTGTAKLVSITEDTNLSNTATFIFESASTTIPTAWS